LTILALKKLGLAHRVNEPSPHRLKHIIQA
jgi:hypothetical protein